MVINTTQGIVTKQTNPPPHHCTISSILNNRFTDGLMHCVVSFMPVCDSTSLSRTHWIISPGNSCQFPVLSWQKWNKAHPAVFCCPSKVNIQSSDGLYLTYLCQSLCYQQAFVDYSHSENCPCYFFLQTPKMTAHEKSQYISSLENTQTRLSGLLQPCRVQSHLNQLSIPTWLCLAVAHCVDYF